MISTNSVCLKPFCLQQREYCFTRCLVSYPARKKTISHAAGLLCPFLSHPHRRDIVHYQLYSLSATTKRVTTYMKSLCGNYTIGFLYHCSQVSFPTVKSSASASSKTVFHTSIEGGVTYMQMSPSNINIIDYLSFLNDAKLFIPRNSESLAQLKEP